MALRWNRVDADAVFDVRVDGVRAVLVAPLERSARPRAGVALPMHDQAQRGAVVVPRQVGEREALRLVAAPHG